MRSASLLGTVFLPLRFSEGLSRLGEVVRGIDQRHVRERLRADGGVPPDKRGSFAIANQCVIFDSEHR